MILINTPTSVIEFSRKWITDTDGCNTTPDIIWSDYHTGTEPNHKGWFKPFSQKREWTESPYNLRLHYYLFFCDPNSSQASLVYDDNYLRSSKEGVLTDQISGQIDKFGQIFKNWGPQWRNYDRRHRINTSIKITGNHLEHNLKLFYWPSDTQFVLVRSRPYILLYDQVTNQVIKIHKNSI